MNFATVKPNLTRTSRTALWVGCLLVGSFTVAQADTPHNVTLSDEVPSVVVSYGDLNLATAAGARTLYKRISTAAHEVCPFEDSKVPAQMAYNHECRAAAIARAVHDINSPQLATLQAGHVKRG
jgi:UrcA family protein